MYCWTNDHYYVTHSPSKCWRASCPAPSLPGRSWNSGVGGRHFYILVSSGIPVTLKNFNPMPMCQEQKKTKGLWEKGGILRWNREGSGSP